jgi:ribosomal protein L37AE/L43A
MAEKLCRRCGRPVTLRDAVKVIYRCEECGDMEWTYACYKFTPPPPKAAPAQRGMFDKGKR